MKKFRMLILLVSLFTFSKNTFAEEFINNKEDKIYQDYWNKFTEEYKKGIFINQSLELLEIVE